MESANERYGRMEGQMEDRVPGWGADLDPQNRPAYPKERTPPRLEGVHWDHPDQQMSAIEVFISPERPGITPVFGTSVPPAGLSGAIRRRFFRTSGGAASRVEIEVASGRLIRRAASG